MPVPGGEHDDSDLDAPLDPDNNGGGQPPGGGPQQSTGTTGHRQMSRRFLWSIMTRRFLLEVCLAVPQFANPDQVLSPPMPWPVPRSQLFLFLFRRIRRVPYFLSIFLFFCTFFWF